MFAHEAKHLNIHRFIISVLVIAAHYEQVHGLLEFPQWSDSVSDNAANFLSRITKEEWRKFVELGVDSVNKQKQLEMNLLSSQITVQNGSISHVQLLDVLPIPEALSDSDVAMKIVKASQYVYNTHCVQNRIDGVECEAFLNDQTLPESELLSECEAIRKTRRDGHHPFRRLRRQKYKDGIHEMFPDTQLPAPRFISSRVFSNKNASANGEPLDEHKRSLALMQWAQFIEHDLSKSVVTSMSNGLPIECCNKDNYRLPPRYWHPACAPLLEKDEADKYGRQTCFNYVRSALAVGQKCTFGGAEQLNQATGYFDLSQLYGFTEAAEKRMRTFQNGEIKCTPSAQMHGTLLPMASNFTQSFCALKMGTNVSSCFMAGDSRVNSNPYTIAIYTIFMRNHNRIAAQLKLAHGDWTDEQTYQTAKDINVDIYRRIIFNEWLPEVIGSQLTETIMNMPYNAPETEDEMQVSNEFATSAIRFYFSMMPDTLHDFSVSGPTQQGPSSMAMNNNVLPDPNLFVLKDQLYKPDLLYSSSKLDDILQSVLHQRAMKFDTYYVESLVPESTRDARPTHADVLAYDIQRGRDHGLQGYVDYLEVCTGTKVNRWRDLENYIGLDNIVKLQSVYKNWSDIDLIIGGLSEKAVNGSTVGPTFTCIIAEQFSKVRQWQASLNTKKDAREDILKYKTMTATDLLCSNSDLQSVPKNIFQLASEKNPLISCSEDRRGSHR